MYETEKFKITYNAIDKRDGHIIGCYDDIDNLIEEVETYCVSHRGYRFGILYQSHNKADTVAIKSYSDKPIDYNIPDPKPRYWYAPYSNYETIYTNVEGVYVVDNLGNIIRDIWSRQKRSNYCGRRSWMEREAQEARVRKGLVRYKNNVNKIKDTYSYYLDYENYYGEYSYHSSDSIGCHRGIHTNSTLKKLTGFVKEDGEPEPRGKQRCLPTTYDDVQCSVYHQHKSWKHNSKRRKQWKDRTNANL
jgi:hypothetical protein